MLYHLNTLVESGRIRPLPVAVDTPLGLLMTDTYQNFRTLFDEEALSLLASGDDPLDFESLYAVRHARDSARLADVSDPMVIIAGSGMCTGGRVVDHLARLLSRSETTVIFPGYQARGTLGRSILHASRRRGHANRAVTINGQEVPVRARVEVLSGLSAHADRQELQTWLRSIPDVRAVALHHGERAVQKRFAEWLRYDGVKGAV